MKIHFCFKIGATQIRFFNDHRRRILHTLCFFLFQQRLVLCQRRQFLDVLLFVFDMFAMLVDSCKQLVAGVEQINIAKKQKPEFLVFSKFDVKIKRKRAAFMDKALCPLDDCAFNVESMLSLFLFFLLFFVFAPTKPSANSEAMRCDAHALIMSSRGEGCVSE